MDFNFLVSWEYINLVFKDCKFIVTNSEMESKYPTSKLE